jgi:hypothetical protein
MTQTIDAAPPDAGADAADRDARRPWRPAALWALAGAVAGAAVFVLAHDALGDDSYITLGYAEQLALHGHWGMLPDRPAHTATSVLNVWLLAAVTVVVRSPVVATGVVLAGTLALAAVWLRGLAGTVGAHRGVTTALGLGLLATSPLLTSTVGLETYLAMALLVGVLRFALGGRWVLAGVLAGALVLARPDMGLFLLPIAAVVPWTGARPWRSLGVGAGTAVAVALPWPVASWWLLGSALPDSLVAKVGAGAWGGMWLFTDAPRYYLAYYPAATLLTVGAAALGVLGLVGLLVAAVRRPAVRPAAAGAVALAGGSLLHIGFLLASNTGPFHWYFAPVLTGFTLVGVLAAGIAAGVAAASRAHRVAWAPAVALGLVVLLSGAFDVQHDGGAWRTAPIRTNWAPTAEYAAVGRWIAERHPGAVVLSPGEVGTIAYFCDCALVDYLSDRAYTAGWIEQRLTQAPPWQRAIFSLNYRHLQLPAKQQPQFALILRDGVPTRDGEWPVHLNGVDHPVTMAFVPA